ncbi:MAG: hypothetical protein QX196_05395 [Methylococcaceae bacterium]|jgi:hypothetical protein
MFTDKKNDVNEQAKKRKEDALAALNSLPPVSSGIPMPKVQPPKNLQPNKEQAAS